MLCLNNQMYLLVFILICAIRSGCVGFMSPLLNHLLHHFQLTRMRRGSPLKALKQKRADSNPDLELHVLLVWMKEHNKTHSAFCCCLIILVLCFGLLLELNHWHSVQVTVCPAVIHTALQQVLCGQEKIERTSDLSNFRQPTNNVNMKLSDDALSFTDPDLEKAAGAADSKSTLSPPCAHRPPSGTWALAVTGSLPATWPSDWGLSGKRAGFVIWTNEASREWKIKEKKNNPNIS